EAPRDPVEIRLAALWKEVLGTAPTGIEDDFFLLGGHSLLATQLTVQIREAFGVDLPVRAVFQAPTVAAQPVLLRPDTAPAAGGGTGRRPADRAAAPHQPSVQGRGLLRPGTALVHRPSHSGQRGVHDAARAAAARSARPGRAGKRLRRAGPAPRDAADLLCR